MGVQVPDRKYRTYASGWDDTQVPSFAAGLGAAAPSIQAFMAPTRLYTFNQGTEDNVDFTLQLPHTQELDVSTITLYPHVHWTAVGSPTADALLYWQFCYTYAKPATTVAAASTFYPVSTLTSDVTTMTGAEYRKHLITPVGSINVPRALWNPSTVIVGNLRMGGASTVDDTTIGLLSFDLHYQTGPNGTENEYS